MRYRAEIDGLRAIAVLPVILFHAGFKSLSGGFVGVDIFFVISGYLITSIILSEINQGQFSIVRFYERRARRILPALLMVMAVCLPCSWFWLYPSEMKEFAQSLIAVSTFSSNILFWRQSGYFDAAAELKPLLHTWSLAVEEQYYILFPPLLMLTRKWRTGWLIAFLAVGGALSLGAAHWAAYARPSAAFFLLPTRAWEMLLGGSAAFHFSRSPVPSLPPAWRQALSLAGLLLIAFSIFAYNGNTPFPSLYALAPTGGALLLILFATEGTWAHRILTNWLLVQLGLISYSAYLWHQPLFAFYRHIEPNEPSLVAMGMLCLLILPVAYASWRFIEKPFREKSRMGRGFVFASTGVTALLFIGVGYVILLANGYEGRYSAEQRKIIAFAEYPREAVYREGICFLRPDQGPEAFAAACINETPGSVLLWGDSHAGALSYGLSQQGWAFSQLTTSGCPPMAGATFLSRPNCKKVNDFVLATIARTHPSTVILHATWWSLKAQLDDVHKTILKIKALSPGTKVVLVGGVPQWSPDLPTVLLRRGVMLDEASISTHLPVPKMGEIEATDELIEKIAQADGATMLRPSRLLCKSMSCQATVHYQGGVMPYTWDQGHLTAGGSLDLAKRLFK